MRRFALIGCLALVLGLPLSAVETPALTAEETPAVKTDAAKEEAPAAKPDAAKPDAAKEEAPAAKEEKPVANADSDKQKAAAAETERQRLRRERHEKEDKERAEKLKKDSAETKETKKEAEAAKPAEKTETAKPAEKTVKPQTIVQFTIKGNYPEGPSAPGLFGEMEPSLANIVQRMDAAAADKEVRAVLLKMEDIELGRAKIYELRGAIARLRKAGKPVYAELTTAESNQYVLATACEQIFMPPSGVLIVPGVRAEVTFYKGLLDKLGLQFDSLQMGKYKGAAEPLTRTEMSKPLRESLDAVVDSYYEDMVATIAVDRRLKDYQVKTLLDQGLFTAAAAQKAGLIDEVLYADQFQDSLKKKLKIDKLEIVTNYKKKRIDTDFSGISGFMKMMELLMGGKPSESSSKKPRIAVVYATGPIVEGKGGSSEFFGESAIGSTSMVAALRKADDDPKVVAIVLRIDSPGGSATASDLIWRETVRIKKPIIASMSDVAGSGGYYIAMGAKKIVAAPGTLTGSIGVIGGKLVVRGLYDKIGLSTEVISRGTNSGSMSSAFPFTPDERKAWTELLKETYHKFVDKAAEGRKMTYDKMDELAQGRVYTGRMAKNLGLVDELGTLADAVADAKTAAGLKADAEVDLLVLPEAKTFFEQLFGDPSASSDLESLLPECFKIVRQTATLRQLLSERFLLWMPYSVQVK
jgi:protease-4